VDDDPGGSVSHGGETARRHVRRMSGGGDGRTVAVCPSLMMI